MSGEFGIDIYEKYQKVTDWQALKNFLLHTSDGAYPISFFMIKGTDGGGRAAVPADRYVAGVKSIGRSVGLYHYAQFSPTPEAQADILIGEVQRLAAYGEKSALDLEAPFAANANALDFGSRFLNRMIARGYPPQMYWNDTFDKSLRSQMEQRVTGGFVKWIARYGSPPTLPGYDTHQYTSSGLVIPGISASGIDGDWAYTNAHKMNMNGDDDEMQPDERNAVISDHDAEWYGGKDSPFDKGWIYVLADMQKSIEALNAKVDALQAVNAESIKSTVADAVVQNMNITGTLNVGTVSE